MTSINTDDRRATSQDPDLVRKVAIDHHHDFAGVFEAHYRDMRAGRFTTAFTYGRYKVDVLLEETLRSLPRGARVLDVGCGTGEYVRRLRALGYDAAGIEPAPAMLEAARRNVPEARIEQGIATELPFSEGSFDAVIQIEVLRYLHRADVRRALRESLRVLTPGGVFFATFVNRWALDGFYVHQRLRQRRLGREFDRRHPHCEFVTPREVERELLEAGFTSVRTYGRLFAPFRIAYLASPALGRRLAERLERLDDALHRLAFTRAFAGHLVAVAAKPGR